HHRCQQVVEDTTQNGQVKAGDDDLGDEKQADNDQGEATHHADATGSAEQPQQKVDRQSEQGDLHQDLGVGGGDQFRQQLAQLSAYLPPLPYLSPYIGGEGRVRGPVSAANTVTASRVGATSWTRSICAARCASAWQATASDPAARSITVRPSKRPRKPLRE